MTFSTLVQLLIGGVASGSIYALVALGLYITHLTVDKVNFGQGDFMMVGAFLLITARASGMPFLIAVAVVILAVGVLGWILERIAIRPLERSRRSPLGNYAWILTTAGVAFILQNFVELVHGRSVQHAGPLIEGGRDAIVHLMGIGFALEELLVAAVVLIIAAAFYRLVFRSRWGESILTVAFNPEASSLLGINTRAIKTGVFVLASMLAGAAGVLIGSLVTLHPHIGLVFTIKALIVAAIGGFSNPIGILLGGLIFGVSEALSNYVDSSFGDMYPLLGALLLIALRPSGLFGEKATHVR
nr:high-affinity branched-chain amino acid transport system permease protein LivH [uncultured bacterium]